MRVPQIVSAWICSVVGVVGQSVEKPVIVAAQYDRFPRLQSVAPGQILTVFVRGLKAGTAQAAGSPVPLELAGVSALIEEPRRSFRSSLPILRIDEIPCGSGLAYVCDFRAVSLQLPMELAALQESSVSTAPRPVITISERGVSGLRTEFALVTTNVHILRGCDLVVGDSAGTCSAIVTHASGARVDAAQPARAGEVITAYAVGLGTTTPLVTSGVAAPIPPPPTRAPVFVRIREPVTAYRPLNAVREEALFAGLVSGFVGLYQINFRVPQEAVSNTRCMPGSETNAEFVFESEGSSDLVGVCVQP